MRAGFAQSVWVHHNLYKEPGFFAVCLGVSDLQRSYNLLSMGMAADLTFGGGLRHRDELEDR